MYSSIDAARLLIEIDIDQEVFTPDKRGRFYMNSLLYGAFMMNLGYCKEKLFDADFICCKKGFASVSVCQQYNHLVLNPHKSIIKDKQTQTMFIRTFLYLYTLPPTDLADYVRSDTAWDKSLVGTNIRVEDRIIANTEKYYRRRVIALNNMGYELPPERMALIPEIPKIRKSQFAAAPAADCG